LEDTVLPKFQQFIRERQYLHNVSPATVSWYTHNFKWMPSESPTEDDLKAMVIRMREKGLRATGCNSAIRSINAYLRWSGSTLKIQQMREERRVLPTYETGHISRIMQWRPKSTAQHRLQAVIATLCDTGARISEVLSLRWEDVDFDNLLLTLHGKGRIDRKTP
jgi:site-specific recombinase XerD